MYDLFITTNGPGEIATWVTPLVKEIKKNRSDVRISLFILPCRFATGSEEEIALGIKEIDFVFPSKRFLSKVLKLPFKPSEKGVVMYLGGDMTLTLLLKWRYGYKAIAYTEGMKSPFYEKIFTRDGDGDLMFSFFEHYKEDAAVSNKLSKTKNIVFFPGSRPEQFKLLFPLFQRELPLIPKEYNCVFSISPFIPAKLVNKLLISKNNIQYYRDKSYELMKSAHLAITIPGTNNIQLAYLNVPALVVFPFNCPEVVHFKGLTGALLNLPILKTFGKRMVLHLLNKRVQYTSLVNRKENKMIYPELRGDLVEKMIADSINNLLESNEKMDNIKNNLKALNKESNVLAKIVKEINGYL